jgi:tRNA dimethylallyltransferase
MTLQPPTIDVLVIAGPTGIGKTALATALAQHLPLEIVSADSRQIYRYMDVATAKPSIAELAAAPHHLIDIVDPDQTLTMSAYRLQAMASISAIAERGRLPVVVGGTGQYITALIEGWAAPEVAPNLSLRAELEALAASAGSEALRAQMLKLDPDAANLIEPRNVRRMIRAIEVSLATGQPFTRLRQQQPPPYRLLELALTMPRESLYTRLDQRIEQMVANGLVAEIESLYARGYGPQLPALSGLGYAQFGAHIRGECSAEAAMIAFKRATHTFVRRQYTWFRHHGNLHWLEQPSVSEVLALVSAWHNP